MHRAATPRPGITVDRFSQFRIHLLTLNFLIPHALHLCTVHAHNKSIGSVCGSNVVSFTDVMGVNLACRGITRTRTSLKGG